MTNNILSGWGTSCSGRDQTAILNANEFTVRTRATAVGVTATETQCPVVLDGHIHLAASAGLSSEHKPSSVGGTSSQAHDSTAVAHTTEEWGSSHIGGMPQNGCGREEDNSGSSTLTWDRVHVGSKLRRGQGHSMGTAGGRRAAGTGRRCERQRERGMVLELERRDAALQGVHGRLGRSGRKVMGAVRTQDGQARQAQRLQQRFCRQDGDTLQEAARMAKRRQHQLAGTGSGSSGGHLTCMAVGWLDQGQMDRTRVGWQILGPLARGGVLEFCGIWVHAARRGDMPGSWRWTFRGIWGSIKPHRRVTVAFLHSFDPTLYWILPDVDLTGPSGFEDSVSTFHKM
ncbi:hypothetical protein B0H14DRAFT_2627566 [Mycena olivaceomarginata]|nr:hypothetical protein B0H14DRAFT_2627566 [Mycena olivaceomarginata]